MTKHWSLPRRYSLFLLLIASVLTAGCDELLPKRSAGEKLYRKHCADCHGVDGSGNTIGYMGNEHADLLDDRWKHGGDPSAIHWVLRNELVFRHPSYMDLTDQDIRQITDHILHLRGETRGR